MAGGLQPYRGGVAHSPGKALDSMRRGRTAFGTNPADARRRFQRTTRRRKPTSSLYARIKTRARA